MLLWTERLLLFAGCLLLAVYASVRIDGWRSSRAALHSFDQAQVQKVRSPEPNAGLAHDDVDFSLWSEERVTAFKASLGLEQRHPLAVLGLQRLRISVPVFEGTDDVVLNRGAGWIVGTAKPGEAGNTGIAAHRDGFFRGLKDVASGDEIVLRTPSETMTYRVVQTEIVEPENVSVLLPQAVSSLTLVTCYPFYYIGSAPRRFIVHATLQGSTGRRN